MSLIGTILCLVAGLGWGVALVVFFTAGPVALVAAAAVVMWREGAGSPRERHAAPGTGKGAKRFRENDENRMDRCT